VINIADADKTVTGTVVTFQDKELLKTPT